MLMPTYSRSRKAFDHIALSYDQSLKKNLIMRWLRSESLSVLESVFAPGAFILEVGSGTGEEALALSRTGRYVVATDISPRMIEEAKKKQKNSESIFPRWHVAAAGNLKSITDKYGRQVFDGAYSSFGSLNCEPDLHQVGRELSQLIKPGGSLVCSVMNKMCLWEVVWFCLHARPHTAFRRFRSGKVSVPLPGTEPDNGVAVYYYSPPSFAKAMSPYFIKRDLRSFPIFLPPPYLEHLVLRRPRIFRLLETWERRLSRRYPFTFYGDHFLMILERMPEEES
jgi:ubiquinone/menaquinone biosynthesis C-methylase UbiE